MKPLSKEKQRELRTLASAFLNAAYGEPSNQPPNESIDAELRKLQ